MSEFPTSALLIDGIRLSLSGPGSLPLSVVLRSSPAYDASRGFFTISLKNESDQTRILPFNELSRSVVLKYRDLATDTEILDNRTPPPKFDGAVERFTASETRTFQVVFEYPKSIATMKDNAAQLTFCVEWESSWLRKQTYASDAYDWNQSFRLCRNIRITND